MSIDYKRIGEQIQKARKLKKWTTGDLAQTAGFTPKSIVLAENGQASLSLDFLMSMCTTLNITPNDLLNGQYACTREQSLEHDAVLTELRESLALLKEEMGVEEGGGTVRKDTQTVMDEFRETVQGYKAEVSRRNALLSKTTTDLEKKKVPGKR